MLDEKSQKDCCQAPSTTIVASYDLLKKAGIIPGIVNNIQQIYFRIVLSRTYLYNLLHILIPFSFLLVSIHFWAFRDRY